MKLEAANKADIRRFQN